MRTDGRTTDGHTDNQRDTIIPRHTGYKYVWWNIKKKTTDEKKLRYVRIAPGTFVYVEFSKPFLIRTNN